MPFVKNNFGASSHVFLWPESHRVFAAVQRCHKVNLPRFKSIQEEAIYDRVLGSYNSIETCL